MRLCLLPAATAILALAGCQKEAPAPQPSGAPSGAASEAAAAPSAPAAEARKVEETNDRYVFAYAYPAAAAAIPKLKAHFDADLAEQRAELVGEAAEGADDAKKGGFPFHPYSRSRDWKVVTDLPGWLSLSTIVSTFTGGAHHNYVYDALLWDKTAGQQRGALDLFTSKQALSAVIGKAFCEAIDRQRQKKRGEPIKSDNGDMFTDCLDPVNYTVILGSSNRATFDRIGVLVPPYEAGPYAEGSYEVTLPVTPKVLALVKPEYKASFAVGR